MLSRSVEFRDAPFEPAGTSRRYPLVVSAEVAGRRLRPSLLWSLRTGLAGVTGEAWLP